MLYCMGCHGAQAEGVPGKVPPLAHSLGRFMRLPAGRNYILRVPGAANSVLSDAQLAEVLNWLARQFNSEELTADVPMFTAAEVTALRHTPLASVLATRREVVRDLAATGSAPPAAY
jgi:mono/diheme cytochrome c family protein